MNTQEAMQKAIEMLSAQKRLIGQYNSLAKVQEQGMKLMSDGMVAVMQSCARIAELTDDPEVIDELRKIMKVGEAIQHDAQLLTESYDAEFEE